MVTMETERLIVRNFRPDDWRDLHEYLSQSRVLEYEPEPPSSVEDCKVKAEERSKSNAFWAVCLKDTQKMIGHVYFNQADPPEFLTWEIGYIFNPAYWGKGYATEACQRMLQYGFEGLGAHRIKAGCSPDNPPSWRLLERLGMRREGYFKQHVFFRRTDEGEPLWLNSYEYAMLDKEYRQRRDIFPQPQSR